MEIKESSYPVTTYKYEHGYGAAYGTRLPGTEEVTHIHGAWVHYREQGKGFGSEYHRDRLDHFEKDECIKLLTCIVNKDNAAEVKILKNNGWEFLKEFNNGFSDLILCCKEV